jgi:hypothetical protein
MAGTPNPARVEGRLDQHRAALEHGGQAQHVQRRCVEQRCHREGDLIRPEVGVHHHVDRIPGDVGVGQRRALGPARGARGVHDQAGVVQADGHVGRPRVQGPGRRPGQQALVVMVPRGRPGQGHEVAEPRASTSRAVTSRAADARDHGRLLRGIHQQRRPAVGELVSEFRAGQPHVERDEDGPGGPGREHGFQEGRMIGSEIRDPGARPGPEPAQRPGQPPDAVIQPGVGQRGARVPDRRRAGGLAGPAGGPRPNALVAHGLLPSAGNQAEQPGGVSFKDFLPDLRLDRQFPEVGQPPVGGEQRVVRAEHHLVLQQ